MFQMLYLKDQSIFKFFFKCWIGLDKDIPNVVTACCVDWFGSLAGFTEDGKIVDPSKFLDEDSFDVKYSKEER